MWANLGALDFGVSTENQWWGPAVRNPLLMSNNAPGIPSTFLRTSSPIKSRYGSLEAKLMAGVLTESRFFDRDPTNDRRSISGWVLTGAPALQPTLTVGLARVVYANAPHSDDLARNALASLTRWSTTRTDSTQTGADAFEQIYSLFGRWIFPEAGLEVYGEWARVLPPNSLRDWLIAPQRSLGYTVGMQAARRVHGAASLRFQAELTNLEQASSTLAGDTMSFYTSRAVPQGYTHHGQVIGAPIGPGGSSQLVGLDYFARRWDVGLFAERIRWNEDVYALQPVGFSFFSHDVTALAGVRGTAMMGGLTVHAEYSVSQRMNFLFQNLRGGFGKERSNDVQSRALRFSLSWAP